MQIYFIQKFHRWTKDVSKLLHCKVHSLYFIILYSKTLECVSDVYWNFPQVVFLLILRSGGFKFSRHTCFK